MESTPMKFGKIKITLGLFLGLYFSLHPAISFSAESNSTSKLSDQRMADSPEALIKALDEISFLTPEQMDKKREIEFGDMLIVCLLQSQYL